MWTYKSLALLPQFKAFQRVVPSSEHSKGKDFHWESITAQLFPLPVPSFSFPFIDDHEDTLHKPPARYPLTLTQSLLLREAKLCHPLSLISLWIFWLLNMVIICNMKIVWPSLLPTPLSVYQLAWNIETKRLETEHRQNPTSVLGRQDWGIW